MTRPAVSVPEPRREPLTDDLRWVRILQTPRSKVSRPTLFLDRDGVIVEEVPYLHKQEDVRFIDGATQLIAQANTQGWMTAWANDYSYETIFSRQVEAHGQPQGVLWALSTSGNSTNVLKAMSTAKSMDMQTLAMTGRGGGKMAALSDILIDIPSNSTPRIQEMHLVVYHLICEQVERELDNK